MPAAPAAVVPSRLSATPGVAACAVAPAVALCYHCGKPNAGSESARWRTVLNGAAREFCCAGCLSIAQTIHVAGLDSFYDRRVEPADRPREAPEARRTPGRSGTIPRCRAASCARPTAVGARCRCCSRASTAARASGCSRPGSCATPASRSPRSTSRRGARAWSGIRRRRGCPRCCARWPPIGYHAFPYDPARREALARRESRALLLRMAVALLRDDAGDDVRAADLHLGRRRRAVAPAAARMGEPHPDAAGDPLLGGAVLPRRVARPAAAASRNGRAGRARPRGRVRRPARGRRSPAPAPSTTTR